MQVRKPIKEETKHRSRAEIAQREYEERLVTTTKSDLDNVPVNMLRDTAARDEYDRLLPLLTGIDIIGDLDRNNLVVYCNAWSEYQELLNDLKTEAHFLVNKNEQEYENPKLKASREAYKQMATAGEKLGMSISSRLNAATLKAKKEEDQLREDFGDI